VLSVAAYFLPASVKNKQDKLELPSSVVDEQLKATVADKAPINVHRWVSTRDESNLQAIKSQKVSQVQNKKVLVGNSQLPASYVDHQVKKTARAFHIFNEFSLPKDRFGEKMSWAIAPISVSEITEKRKKIARGEKLHARVIKKREAPLYIIK